MGAAAVYRVYLFSGGGDDRSWATDTLDVWDADVDEVIAWAESRLGPGDLYSVALRQGDGDDRGLVWLVGFDMNDEPPMTVSAPSRLGCRSGATPATRPAAGASAS